MGTRESYEPGIPSWIDLMSPDVDASKAFYTELFGWDAEDQHDDEGNRIYTMFRNDGRDVAGLGGQLSEMEGSPAVWNHYVSVDDADAAVQRATNAGGSVVMEPMDVMTSGRMAVLADPTGAVTSVWQPGDHIGAQLVNGPGAFSWSELTTRQVDDARPFYEEVFGWTLHDQDMGEMGTYTTATFDGERSFAGMMSMPDDVPAEVPNYWGIYIGHDDVDAAAAQVQQLGGDVVAEPFEVAEVGRMAVLRDPQGAMFTVMQSDTWQD